MGRPLPACSFLALLMASAAHAAASAVPTFESIGLYWSGSGGSASVSCDVRYRVAGEAAWKDGQPLWFDARALGGRPAGEYRGSLVHLRPGTTYEVQLSLRGTSTTATLQATTWSETFPIARTVTLPATSSQTLELTESGTANGYVLYTHAPGGSATIDLNGAASHGVRINASYVIVRGVAIRRPAIHGIVLEGTSHDVVIEENDISGWGRIDTDGWGVNYDSAVYSTSQALRRVVVQRNRMHHPRSDSNSWAENRAKYNSAHPRGPQGISFQDSSGNHVLRFNELFSDDTHVFNDGFGFGENFSTRGFPGPDSDIHGNIITHCWDDGIEAEGGGMNVRIWANYLDRTYPPIATSTVSLGPTYIFRNVFNRSRMNPVGQSDSGGYLKWATVITADSPSGGRRYAFHNTSLQAPPLAGSTGAEGLGSGPRNNGTDRPITQTMTRNNIFHLRSSNGSAISVGTGAVGNDMDYDLTNGRFAAHAGAETNGRIGVPVYAPGHGAVAEATGRYQLAAGSPGHDQGEVLPNFNDGYQGAAPDIGAHEAGTPPMEFGVEACRAGAPAPAAPSPDAGTPGPGPVDAGAPADPPQPPPPAPVGPEQPAPAAPEPAGAELSDEAVGCACGPGGGGGGSGAALAVLSMLALRGWRPRRRPAPRR